MKRESARYKVGRVALVGRPNVGKSTLLNALVGQKVAIVTPKPQTTQSQIEAYFEDERGQIFFLDTPGFFAGNKGAKRYNFLIKESLALADVVVYVVDKLRDWGEEDERVWTMVETLAKPVILVINKIDRHKPDFSEAYRSIVGPKVKAIIEISAAEGTHIKAVLTAIFAELPEGKRDAAVDNLVSPLMSQSSTEFLGELVREKVYLATGQEIPYQTYVRIQDIEDNELGLKIRGTIFVTNKRYKPMLIGRKGQKIKQISEAVKKELELVTSRKVLVRLMVEVED